MEIKKFEATNHGSFVSLSIILGYTDDEDVRAFYSELGYGDAGVKVKGNKIIVAAYTYDSFNDMMSEFGGDEVEIPEEVEFSAPGIISSISSTPCMKPRPLRILMRMGTLENFILSETSVK